jgi:cyclopropane fatty-acyl-phospholipid synthase-like methyltransferase
LTLLSHLDVGCGQGGISLVLLELGADSVTRVDVEPRLVRVASANAARLHLEDRATFVREDVHSWTPPHRFAVLLSHEALEHIHHPGAFLKPLRGLVTDTGVVVLAFRPSSSARSGITWTSFSACPIPWRGALFSEQAILWLRGERFRPTDPATTYAEINGGLNLLRYSEFCRFDRRGGLGGRLPRREPAEGSRARVLSR